MWPISCWRGRRCGRRNRTAAIHWRQPVAFGAAIADGEPSAFLDRGYARVAACILVLRSNHAAHNLSPAASGFHPRGECCARLPCESEEHTYELQSRGHLVCRLLLEKENI